MRLLWKKPQFGLEVPLELFAGPGVPTLPEGRLASPLGFAGNYAVSGDPSRKPQQQSR